MSVAVRVLDDGAWVSVDDERRVPVSELWQPIHASLCECSPPDLLVGGFVEAGVDGRTIETRAYGECIRCGAAGTTGWLPVGRLVDGEFYHLDRERPLGPTEPVAPDEESRECRGSQ